MKMQEHPTSSYCKMTTRKFRKTYCMFIYRKIAWMTMLDTFVQFLEDNSPFKFNENTLHSISAVNMPEQKK